MRRVMNGKFTEFDISLDDKVGALADITEMLAKSGVNIRAISADKGRGVRLVTSDEKTTRDILKKGKFLFEESGVISLQLLDRPGELARVSRVLSRERVSIHSVYMLGGQGETKDVILKVSNIEDALKAMKK